MRYYLKKKLEENHPNMFPLDIQQWNIYPLEVGTDAYL